MIDKSNTVSAALARLLLSSMSIGILVVVASAQVKPQNVLPPAPAPAPGGGGCDKTMSCSFKCGLLGCLVGCLKNPTIKCSAISWSVSVALARLLLLNLCIGIGVVATSSENVLPQRQSCPDCSENVTCYIKCSFFGCLAHCLTNPAFGCGVKCFLQNVGCCSTCRFIEFPDT
ncbi:hypothetical protein GQ457_07G039250 [Hibiscus cannabinus]